MKKLSLVAIFIAISFASIATDYYWVGGSGDWSQISHWATTSGGSTFHPSVPGGTDDVHFDANSFTAPGQMVNLNVVASCKNMDWTGATHNPMLDGGSNLIIYGSLTAIPNMIIDNYNFQFSGTGTHSIDFEGHVVLGAITIDGAGTFNLLDSINTNNYFNFKQGTFNTNNHKIHARAFHTSGSASMTFNAGTSLIELDQSNSNYNSSTLYFPSSSLTFNGGQSTIHFSNKASVYSNFQSNYAQTFGKIICENIALYAYLGNNSTADSIFYLNPSTDQNYLRTDCFVDYIFCKGKFRTDNSPTINNAVIMGDFNNYSTPTFVRAELYGNFYSNQNITFDTLLLLREGASTTHSFGSGRTTTINDSFCIKSNGCFKALVKASSSTPATISMPAGTQFSTDFIDLQNITASGGGSFNAGANSDELGGNTGWTFNGSTYTLSLRYNYVCIPEIVETVVQAVPDGPATGFWWKETIGAQDTFNYMIDTLMLSNPGSYVFVSEYGKNCLLEDSVIVRHSAWAQGVAQEYGQNADQTWYNCSNWDNGYLPDSISNVIIGANDTVYLGSTEHWCENLTNNGTIIQNGGTLNIHGDFTNNGSYIQNDGKLIFAGQEYAVVSNTGSSLSMDSVLINRNDSMRFNCPFEITKSLKLESGIVMTSASDSFVFQQNTTLLGGSTSAYFDGPIYKNGTNSFTFLTGDNGRYARIAITDPTESSMFKAEYFDTNYVDTLNHSSAIEKISSLEYWQLDRVEGSGAVKVTLFFGDSLASGITTMDSITVCKHNGSQWNDMGVEYKYNGGTWGYFRSDLITEFSPFTFGSIGGDNPLPVEFIAVSAEWSDDVPLVQWTTATEVNNSHFEVERSYDSEHFTYVATIESQDPNSTQILDYKLLDNSAELRSNETLYYRVSW